MTARPTVPGKRTTRASRRSLLALSLAALLPLSLAPAGTADAKVAPNAPAPDFTLDARGGQKLSLSQYKGQVVMINFWATWCPPCRAEMPALERLQPGAQIFRRQRPQDFRATVASEGESLG